MSTQIQKLQNLVIELNEHSKKSIKESVETESRYIEGLCRGWGDCQEFISEKITKIIEGHYSTN